MSDFLVAHEPWIRVSAFVTIFVVMALWEVAAPRRALALPRLLRWPSNLALVVLNSVLMRLLLPTTAVAVAIAVEQNGYGLLNEMSMPFWLRAVLSLVLLDLAIYAQHRLFHAVPALWRLHRMHHADVDVDATNALRFHPLEIALSLGIKFAVIAAVGAPPATVVVFEVLLNGLAIFNHSNVAIARRLDRWLRWFIVTPDMHRIHHSWHLDEMNCNFGFNLACWDRLFDTYLADPHEGHNHMTLGLTDWRAPEWRRLDRMLIQPLLDPKPRNSQLEVPQ